MEKTQPFTVSRNTIFWTFLTNPSTGLFIWIVLLIGLIFIGIGCFMDIRYLILGLIICLTALPAMAFFAFVNYMFASEMVANLLNHTVERHNNGYLLRIYRPANQDEPIEAGKNWIESGRFSLFDSNIIKKKFSNKYEIIFFRDSPLSVLFLPRY